MPETVTYRTAMNLKANDEVIHCGRTRKVAGKRSRDGKIIVTFYGGSESMFNPNENLKIAGGSLTGSNALPGYMGSTRPLFRN